MGVFRRFGAWVGERRRRIARSLRRGARYPVVIALPVVLLAFLTGVVGWSGHDNKGLADNSYRTLQLFVLQVGVDDTDGIWLDIARFLAPLGSASAIWAFAALMLNPIRSRWRRNHVVICGLGRKGYLITRALTKENKSVVVLEQNPDNKLIQPCREDRALVLVGDARTEEMLKRARVNRARCVIAVCGEDGVNAEIGVAVSNLPTRRTGKPRRCLVHIVDPALWKLLGSREIRDALEGRRPAVDIDYFNVYSRGAQVALDQLANDEGCLDRDRTTSAPQHLVVVGAGRFGRSLIVRATRRAARIDQSLVITIVDQHANEAMDTLRMNYRSWPSGLGPVEAKDVQVPSEEFLGVKYAYPDPTVVCISLDSDRDSLIAGLLMEELGLAGDAPVYVRMVEEEGLARLLPPRTASSRTRIRPIAMLEATCNELLLTGGMFGEMARCIHNRYIEERTDAGEAAESNELMKPWEQVAPVWREHKRYRLQRLLLIMSERGYGFDTAGELGKRFSGFSRAEINELAELAHEDYRAQMKELARSIGRMRRKERQWTRVRQDVPWRALDPKIRQRDLSRVEHLPATLAQEGILVIPPQTHEIACLRTDSAEAELHGPGGSDETPRRDWGRPLRPDS